MNGKPMYFRTGIASLGTDPELFVKQDGRIIGSEKVIPEDGLPYEDRVNKYKGAITRDGVQAELHVQAHTCRALVAGEIKTAMATLSNHLEIHYPKTKIDLTPVVEISRVELDSLSEQSRVLGCAPSRNFYDPNANVEAFLRQLGHDQKSYLKRSLGGHLHFGIPQQLYPESYKHRELLAPLCDTFIGNQCVMLDRNKDMAERRQVYGRAGEFRTPEHGFEYRTLSNFWLRALPLFSLVFGMAKQVTSIFASSVETEAYMARAYAYTGEVLKRERAKYADDPIKDLLSAVDLQKVERAINTNDASLAWENYKAIKPAIVQLYPEGSDPGIGLSPVHFGAFERLVENIDQKGIEKVFPANPVDHWRNLPSYPVGYGWESYANSQIGV